MVVDSSALIAILEGESESRAFRDLIVAAEVCSISSATMFETSMVVLARQGEDGMAELRDFVHDAAIEVVAFNAHHAELALEAFRRFGKGRHPAALNFGDCFSYALSRSTGEPLLFKGEDFSRTDIKPAA
ncbi:MAG TPA: type II toxin-antitoxin system VapC family toxin [Mesorhizobium sp.]|jgi:ribonuclease VapC|nr:type II toxin-antitoxin system VapC family toxin [Mesorhizobium sp.]